MSRPELQAPPEIFYNEEEADKYTFNTHIVEVQTQMAERCLQLINLESPGLLLDIGCGSGLSGDVIRENGHLWIGIDIAPAMLEVAQREYGQLQDLLIADMGEQIRWRPGVFDGAISVSALQWLCNAETADQEPWKRLTCFFQWLYAALAIGARAALQFYPKDDAQMDMIKTAALKSGFSGGIVTDNPKSIRAKKYYLFIWSGGSSNLDQILPAGIDEDDEEQQHVRVGERRSSRRSFSPRKAVKDRQWVRRKKEQMRKRGRDVKADSKYTGRKRQDRL